MPDIADSRITELIRLTRPLAPPDSVSRAIAALRASGGSAAPVVSGMQVVGIIRETDLLPQLATTSNGGNIEPERLSPVEALMQQPQGFLSPKHSIREAISAFADTGAEMLPVVNEYGGYAGYLLRADVMAALSNAIRPPAVGGLATPLGVHLTCGSQRGGVSDAGLVLLGVLFGLLGLAGFAMAMGLYFLAQQYFGQPLLAALLSEPTTTPSIYNVIIWMAGAAPVLTVLLGIRLLPVAGYHAAEHQTVHAIEQGEPLSYDVVRRMPRVHPRCGTNVAVAASIFILLITAFPSPLVVFGAILIVLLVWRPLGAWLQYHVTTKAPSQRQIESGIKAGEQLLKNYHEEMVGERPGGKRIWNVGFAQIGLGLAVTLLAAHLIATVSGISLPFM